MTAYPHIAARLFGHAHCIEPHALRTMIEGPMARRILAGERLEPQLDETRPHAGMGKKARKSALVRASTSRLSAIVDCEPVLVAGGVAEFGLTDAGVAILPVCGILSRRFDWLTAMCGWTTYEGLSAAFDQMLADSRVKAILMDVESPGGEAAGMLDICDKIIAARASKPVWAVANTFAASAAYGIAGSAERLVLPRLAAAGSIGAVRVHIDQSAYDQAVGDKYTAIYSGARKIDGWGHAPLSEGARKSFQDDVDNCRDQFAELVGRQGRMTAAQALKTEAAMYSDAEAVSARLADAVQTFDDALSELSDLATGGSRSSTSAAASAGSTSTGGPQPMKTETPAPAADVTKDAPQPDKPATGAAAPGAATAPAKTETAEEGDDNCPSCNGSGKKTKAEVPAAPAQAAAPAATVQPTAETYTAATASETMELCTLAGANLATARAFIDAKTPIDKVRSQLAASRAGASGAELNPTPQPQSQTAGWDEAVAAVNKQNGFETKK